MSTELHQIIGETNQHVVMDTVDDSLVEKLWLDLDGQVSREQIGRVVTEIAARLQRATVTAFVPIFVHRQALEQLQGLCLDKGHIITNYYVIENAEDLVVTLSGGQVYDATVVGSDPANDLAVIRIDAGADLPAPLEMGDSEELRVGQFVQAIGNPYGLQQALTTGVVSALGCVIEGGSDNSFTAEAIQTDAAINAGNSGGPLLDLQGRVIGVNS